MSLTEPEANSMWFSDHTFHLINFSSYFFSPQQAKDQPQQQDSLIASGTSGNLAHSPFKLPPGLPPGLPLVLRPPMMNGGPVPRMPHHMRMPGPPGGMVWAPPRPPFNPIIAQVTRMNLINNNPNSIKRKSNAFCAKCHISEKIQWKHCFCSASFSRLM